MAFASGPVSCQRFIITGPLPENIDDQFIELLQAHTFGQGGLRPDDTQIGWVGPRHLFDTDIDATHVACGPFAHFALRVDTLKTPPNVLKAYVKQAEEAALTASGREHLSRAEKRAAREQAAEQAEQEARAGNFRRSQAYPFLLDLENREAYLGSLSPAAADRAMQLFFDTFGCALEPVDPERVAVRVAERTNRSRDLEGLSPFVLTNPPEGSDNAALGTTDLNFLGKEFLTWLWYRTETDDNLLRLRDKDQITVMIDRTLRLKCDFGLTGVDVITADSPTRLPEAHAALRHGKQPTRMGLILGMPAGEFRLTLEAERWTIAALNVPEDDSEQGLTARLEQRFELIADTAHLLDALFELFIESRLARNWPRELQSMSAWAAGTQQKPIRSSA